MNAEETKIPWTHFERPDGTLKPGYTFNPHWGCVHVSHGCKGCYAETWAKRTGWDVWGPNAPRRFFGEAHWGKPLEWNKRAEKVGEMHAVFCASMGDWAEDRRDLDPMREKLFELVERTRNLLWLMLTHRPHDANRLLPSRWMEGAWPSNAWLGVTVEAQAYVDRVKEALKAPAPVHFVSFEPALELAHFSSVLGPQSDRILPVGERRASWLIAGCESGQHPRPMPLYVAESALGQCRDTGAKFFMKQINAELLGLGRKNQVIEEMARFPEHLRVREFPRMPVKNARPTLF